MKHTDIARRRREEPSSGWASEGGRDQQQQQILCLKTVNKKQLTARSRASKSGEKKRRARAKDEKQSVEGASVCGVGD